MAVSGGTSPYGYGNGHVRTLAEINALLDRYRVPRRKPDSVGGYPPGLIPERLWREWLRAYDAYRVGLLGRLKFYGKSDVEVRRLLVQRDATAARLAERDMRVDSAHAPLYPSTSSSPP